MSITKIRTTVEEFISNGKADALAIRGAWGTGKTYYWNHVLQDAVNRNLEMPPRYAYVSLFGINTLQELKQRIFTSTIEKEIITSGINLATLKANVSKLISDFSGDVPDAPSRKGFFGGATRSGAKKLMAAASQTAFVRNWAPFLSDASFLAVNNQLICIDDFERKGATLDARDILGLVSFLKEQRSCKIVLIFNDAYLDAESKRYYAEFREKVVDVDVLFDPTVKEAVAYVFNDSDPHTAQILRCATILKLTNIRILQRIRRLIDGISVALEGRSKEVTEPTVASLVLFAWCFFSRGDDVVPLEHISYIEFTVQSVKEQKDAPEKTEDKEAAWSALLARYGYHHTDELDLTLAEYVRNGYADIELLQSHFDRMEGDAKSGRGREQYRDVWKQYYGSLDNNEEEFVEALINEFKKNETYLSVGALNESVKILRRLDRQKEANDILESYIAAHKYNKKTFSIEDDWFSEPLDAELKRRFLMQRGLVEPPKQVAEIVDRITTKDSWRADDLPFLAARTVQEYVDFLKATDGKILYSYIRTLLRFESIGGATQEYFDISRKTHEALAIIAADSRINRIRLSKYLKPGPVPPNLPDGNANQPAASEGPH